MPMLHSGFCAQSCQSCSISLLPVCPCGEVCVINPAQSHNCNSARRCTVGLLINPAQSC
jgi:hypothetical protein